MWTFRATIWTQPKTFCLEIIVSMFINEEYNWKQTTYTKVSRHITSSVLSNHFLFFHHSIKQKKLRSEFTDKTFECHTIIFVWTGKEILELILFRKSFYRPWRVYIENGRTVDWICVSCDRASFYDGHLLRLSLDPTA